MKRITVTLDDESIAMYDHIAKELSARMGPTGRSDVARLAIRVLYQELTDKRRLTIVQPTDPARRPRQEGGEQ
jgi:hypothetical protein